MSPRQPPLPLPAPEPLSQHERPPHPSFSDTLASRDTAAAAATASPALTKQPAQVSAHTRVPSSSSSSAPAAAAPIAPNPPFHSAQRPVPGSDRDNRRRSTDHPQPAAAAPDLTESRSQPHQPPPRPPSAAAFPSSSSRLPPLPPTSPRNKPTSPVLSGYHRPFGTSSSPNLAEGRHRQFGSAPQLDPSTLKGLSERQLQPWQHHNSNINPYSGPPPPFPPPPSFGPPPGESGGGSSYERREKDSALPPPMTKRWPPARDNMFWRNHSPTPDTGGEYPGSAGPSSARSSGRPIHYPESYAQHPGLERMPPQHQQQQGGPHIQPLSADYPPAYAGGGGSGRPYPLHPAGYENLPASRSAGYPGGPYEPLPGQQDIIMRSPPGPAPRELDSTFRPVGDDFAQALAVYEHLMSALPHVRPVEAPPTHQGAQEFEGLLSIASDAVGLLYGDNRPPFEKLDRPPSPRNKVLGKRSGPHGPGSGSGIGGSEKKPTIPKCLGCGATETPEWRRGPLGPRTLCNACGLVHMKMLRKQRKEAEKAAMQSAQQDMGR